MAAGGWGGGWGPGQQQLQAEEEKPAATGGLLDEILTGWGEEEASQQVQSAAEEPTLAALEAQAAAPAEPTLADLGAQAEAPAAAEQFGQEDASAFAEIAQAVGEAASAEAPPASEAPPLRAAHTRPLLEAARELDTVDVLRPRGFPVAGPEPARPGGLAWVLFGVAGIGCVVLAAVAILLFSSFRRAAEERERLRHAADKGKQDVQDAISQRDVAQNQVRRMRTQLTDGSQGLVEELKALKVEKKRVEEEAARTVATAEKAAEERKAAVVARNRALELKRRAESSLAASAKVSRAIKIMNSPRRLLEAEALLTESIKSGYYGPEAWLWRGWARMKLRKPEAVDDFVKADEVVRAGVMSQALLYAGDASRMLLGDPDMAREYYRRAARGKDDYSLIARARYVESLGEIDEALKSARRAVKKNPTLWEAHFALAEIDAKKVRSGPAPGSVDENLLRVAGEFGQVTELNPLLGQALAAKAEFLFDAYLATEDRSLLLKADRDAERACRTEPQLCYAKFVRARTLIALGRPKEALAYLETVLREEPWRSRAWGDKGTALLMLEKPEEAGGCFEKAIELDKRSVPSHLGLAGVYMALGKFDGALKVLQRAVSLRKDWPETHMLIAHFHLYAPQRHDAEKAKAAARLAHNLTGGKNIRAIIMLVRTCIVLKDRQEAEEYLRIGRRISPENRTLLALEEQLHEGPRSP